MRLSSLFVLTIAVVSLSGREITRSGIHREDMDTQCKPCTDFWRYVNGAWLDRNPIPAHASWWGPQDVLVEATRERLRTLLESAAADTDAKPGSNRRKMGDFYASCMDTASIDARGASPLQADFDRIDTIQSLADLGFVLSTFQRMGRPFGGGNAVVPSSDAVVGAFHLTSGQDAKNPARVVAHIVGSSILSLPNRDYYFKDDGTSRNIRDAFVQHVTKLLELSGEPRAMAERHAAIVLTFETALAESMMTSAERTPEKTYHLMDERGVRALAPNFDWVQLLREVGLPESTPINAREPELLKKFNNQLTNVSLADWKAWLRWRTLKINAPYLAASIMDEDFRFERTVLAGVRAQPPRWLTCVNVVDRYLSDALGQAYVEKYFPPEAKRRMGVMVENMRATMRDELEHSDWLHPETKNHAIEKLNALQVEIGYPSKWRDYSALRIDRHSLFDNARAAWIHGRRYELAKIGQPVNRTDWTMTPTTVDAYSSGTKIVFPAGKLQPPDFDMEADDAANYGAIGVTIGHEMGHQFDNRGSRFDATGALRNWWTEDDRRKFELRTGCVVEQFNTLDVGEGLHHNGKQVLGEALGDLSGITIAYKAYKRSLAGKLAPVMDGFTADQRFFIAFARKFGIQFRPEATRLLLSTNSHPLPQYRAIATLQNLPEFHRAFDCTVGDSMVRSAAQQCKLW